MAERSKGKCRYCGKEYAFGYMGRHLAACKKRQERLAAETGKRQCGYFEMAIYGKCDHDYWLIVEVRDTATLKDVDQFLRDIWLECCGHLSAFEIGGVSYEVMPDADSFWGESVKSMNVKLKSILEKGMVFDYDYDFGSTTELKLKVLDYRTGHLRGEKVTLLSRNNSREFVCDKCGKKSAVFIDSEEFWSGGGLLCEDCAEDAGDEGMLLSVCNSPRMGTCAYEGSDIYPDQFEPDTDRGIEGAR